MRKRIFLSMCLVSFLSVVLASICVTAVFYRYSFDNMKRSIRDEAVYIVASLNEGNYSSLYATQATFTRLTLVDHNGVVLFDSVKNPQTMENHISRPEIAGALKNGAAETQRVSKTVGANTYYRAVRLQSGQVVRISGTTDSTGAAIARYMPILLLASLASAMISAVVARYQTLRIAAPLNAIILDDPMANDVYEELSPLLRRMEQQRQHISEQMEALSARQREFSALTANMREGLILLGGNAEVLWINQSALKILGMQKNDCLHRYILTINRSEEFQETVGKGLSGTGSDDLLMFNGRYYQMLVNPILKEEAVTGAIMLFLDVTDQQKAEQMRREFSANVSHELKTPLTSISGYAELMKDGMVKTEDMPQFANRIFLEAGRMIALVEDIIRLSHLDEGVEGIPAEEVELYGLSTIVLERLETQAKINGVTLLLEGEKAVVTGVRLQIEELVHNLCDNAIKYNKKGGKVTVAITKTPDTAVVEVTDTGSGIPRKDAKRVFERFYRVDKSHSKTIGGTGLGLSIVKHIAICHNAKIKLDSIEGEGTSIKVVFPTGLGSGA